MTRIEATTYSWVRWVVDSGHSSWHQVREDALPRLLEVQLEVLRLWTRCGFEVPDPREVEIWPGASTPPGLTCVYCTRRFLVGTLPPPGTPPVPGPRHRVFLVNRPRRKGSAWAPPDQPVTRARDDHAPAHTE